MKKISIFIPLILGTIVGFFLMNSYDFYKTLDRPFFAPPSWIFPVVWTILYLLMGISYYVVRNKSCNPVIKQIFYLQLFFNLLWPIVFFIFEQLLLSSIWIVGPHCQALLTTEPRGKSCSFCVYNIYHILPESWF